MQTLNIKTLLLDWINKEKKRVEQKNKRRYLHFDARIYNVNNKLVNEISDPDYVVRRFFYPFISDTQTTRRYKIKDCKKIIDKKSRPICYASHKDAFIFSWYGFILSHLYEAKVKELGISENAIAYRGDLRKNNVHFTRDVFDFIKNRKDCVALCLDIVGFFDNLDHKIIKNAWKNLLYGTNLMQDNGMPNDHFAVYKASTKYSFVVKKNILRCFGITKKNIKDFKTICDLNNFQKVVRKVGLIQKNKDEKGIPQGLAVSSVLSNAYMLDFDLSVAKYVSDFNGIYRRYSDDIVIVCNIDNYKTVEDFIKREILKLKMN